MAFRAVLVTVTCTLTVITAEPHPLSDEFIDHINSKQTSWKAGRNFNPNTPMEQLKRLLGVDPDFKVNSLPKVKHETLLDSFPERFDPREKWPNCPSLKEIRDQGSCSSSWAFGAVEVMTDRVCIFSNGTKQFHFSAEDLVSCCRRNGGCNGKGKPLKAWEHWKRYGIVSGGNYNSSEGCKPYSFPPCEHHAPESAANLKGETSYVAIQDVKTPQCKSTCDKNYQKSYEEDKMYGKEIYNVELDINIKAELLNNGPVETVFWLYTDFFNYKSGVYYYTGGDFVGFHAVKLLGWGVENGKKYWLAANSWNKSWGEDGFFKILRGEDHIRVESNVITGKPLL